MNRRFRPLQALPGRPFLTPGPPVSCCTFPWQSFRASKGLRATGGQPSGCRQGDAAPHCPYRRVMGCIPHYELSIPDSVSLYAMTVSHHEFSVLKAKGQTLQCHNQSRCRKKFFKNFLLALKMQKQLGKSDSFYMITCFYYCIK